MKKILIIGSGSYVGKSLQSYLSAWEKDYRIESISVRDDAWRQLSFADFDVIYHCAAVVHQPETKNDPSQAAYYEAVNTRLPYEVARKAKADGVKQFIFLSTAAVYGIRAAIGKERVITAQTPMNPTDLYGKSKAEAEKNLRTLEDGNFKVVIIRPPMIYGPGCKGNYNTLSALARKLPLFPKISNRHFMIFIDNLSEFVRLVIDREDCGIFCPQNSQIPATDELVSLIAQTHGKRIILIPGFTWALRLLGKFTDKAEKAFGSLCYSDELSAYPEDYCVVPFAQSVLITEKP